MRKPMLAVLLVAAVLIPQPANAWSNRDDWRSERCRYARSDGEGGFTIREVARTIECAAGRWNVPVERALSIARCESGLRANALGGGTYIGIYQFHPDTFRSAYAHRIRFARRWDLKGTAWNARSNVVIAIRIMQRTYAPWACA